MKLTSTNRPFGLSIEFTLRSEIVHDSLFEEILNTSFVVIRDITNTFLVNVCSIYSVVEDRASEILKFAGEFTARVTPVPIPNTEVKPRWADGTARVSVWEIR